MSKIISCCGVVCSECEYYPETCAGCPEIKGKVFWTEYMGQDICGVYDCCVNKKGLDHCGQCSELPCEQFMQEDPSRSHEENLEMHRMQLEILKKL